MKKNEVIDFHVHVYPAFNDLLGKIKEAYPDLPIKDDLDFSKLKKLLPLFHKAGSAAQGVFGLGKRLPGFLNKVNDKYVALLTFYSIIIESSINDLLKEMERLNVTKAVLIAHPPMISNEFILDLTEKYPDKFIPYINVSLEENPAEKIDEFVEKGAMGLKIHHAADGINPMDQFYTPLLDKAKEHKLPVILHTGCFHMKPIHKCPEYSHAKEIEPYFKKYPELTFILAHMNYKDPKLAMEYAKTYDNVFVDISWQDTEIIFEALNKVPTEKILFGSDWPLVGNNIEVTLNRVLKLHHEKAITDSQLRKILRENALQIHP
ncbi:MAG: amidohydrolase family protein [Bacteriovoracaceae bacterium]|nr:amidohydrolase family protein [Bacteriovoracaceae bacterium]